jgi:hypothetical protein
LLLRIPMPAAKTLLKFATVPILINDVMLCSSCSSLLLQRPELLENSNRIQCFNAWDSVFSTVLTTSIPTINNSVVSTACCLDATYRKNKRNRVRSIGKYYQVLPLLQAHRMFDVAIDATSQSKVDLTIDIVVSPAKRIGVIVRVGASQPKATTVACVQTVAKLDSSFILVVRSESMV